MGTPHKPRPLLTTFLLLCLSPLPGSNARFWQSTSDATTDGDPNSALCRSGQLMTGMLCRGSFCDDIYLQCAHALVPPGAIELPNWSSWFSEESPNFAANCTAGTLVSGIRCKGDNCDQVSLHCSALAVPVSWGRPQWSSWTSDGSGTPFETSSDTFIMGAQCQGRYCDDMRFLMVKLQRTDTGSVFEERTVAEVRNAAQPSRFTVLDIETPVGYVVGTAQNGRVLVGSKALPPAQTSSFRNSIWEWVPDPYSPSADYKQFTFSTPLRGGSAFALEAPRDPTTAPPLQSIVALASANNTRLTCVNINENLQVNTSLWVSASLYCLPYSVFPPRTVLISDPKGRVDVTALLAGQEYWGPLCPSSPGTVTNAIYCGVSGMFENYFSIPTRGTMPSFGELYGMVGPQLKFQAMEQFDRLGYPVVRQTIDMFLRFSQRGCRDCMKSSRLQQTHTLLGWDFEGVHTMREEDARQAQTRACGSGQIGETLRLTLNLEARNQEFADTLVDAYAKLVAASAFCFSRTYNLSGIFNTSREFACDIQIPHHVSLSIWELGGEQANMFATARMTDCNEGLPAADSKCGDWQNTVTSVLGLMRAIPKVGMVAGAASGVLGFVCAA